MAMRTGLRRSQVTFNNHQYLRTINIAAISATVQEIPQAIVSGPVTDPLWSVSPSTPDLPERARLQLSRPLHLPTVINTVYKHDSLHFNLT